MKKKAYITKSELDCTKKYLASQGKYLAIRQLALKMYYNGCILTYWEAVREANEHGFRSGSHLLKMFNHYCLEENRIGFTGREEIEKQIELMESIMNHIHGNRKASFVHDLWILRDKLANDSKREEQTT